MRIQAVVNAGAYRFTPEALNAAATAVEIATGSGFEGGQEELEALLLEGLDSGDPIEADQTFLGPLTAIEPQSVAVGCD